MKAGLYFINLTERIHHGGYGHRPAHAELAHYCRASSAGYVRFVDLRRRVERFTSEQRGHSHLVAPLCSASLHPMVALSKELPEREPPSIQAIGAGSSCESPSQIISKASRASPIVKVLRPMCHP